MKVSVTRAHIQAGKRSDGYKCPLALAVKEAFNAHHVHAAYTSIDVYMTEDCWPRRFKSTLAVKHFISYFDRFQKDLAVPFDFELELK